jgi:hypothetical protein
MANREAHAVLTRRIFSRFALLACVAALPNTARAANNCPWLTEATASSLIGVDSVGAFNAATETQPAVCTFTQKDRSITRSLTITVEIAKDPHPRMTAVAQACGSNAAVLNAIGNEAVYCAADPRRGELGERAVGRVRDQVFTIVLNTKAKDEPVLTRDALKTRIYTAAEQVAGNLF